MWDGEVFLTSNSSKPASSIAALMLRFMYSGMYGSVCQKKQKNVETIKGREEGREKTRAFRKNAGS